MAAVKFILGTHTIGDNAKDPIAVFDKTEDVNTFLNAFKSRGYSHLDTARNYSVHAPGSTEPRLGLADVSQFTVHTKIEGMGANTHSKEQIAASIQKSLTDLKLSSVETMMLHMPDRVTPFQETAEAINEAYKQGKFKYFGLSNYTADEVAQYIDICEKNGFVKPSVYEGHYNAVVRAGEGPLFPLLRKHNMAFYAYSPAAAGLFNGNVDSAARWSKDIGLGQGYRNIYKVDDLQGAVNKVLAAAKKHNIGGHAAALRWVAHHSQLNGKYGDGVVFGASKVEQIEKSLDALEAGPLPAELADAISGVYATVEDVAPAYHQ